MKLADVLGAPSGHPVVRIGRTVGTDSVSAAAARAGWRFVHLVSTDLVDKADVMVSIREAFGFPGWFGGNLDALADSLGDVIDQPGTVVLWEGWASLAAADPRLFGGIGSVLRSRAGSDNAARFVTILRDAPVA